MTPEEIEADKLEIFGLQEDPEQWERLIHEEWILAERDVQAGKVLRAMYWEKDRDAAFQRFLASIELSHLLRVFERFGIRRDAPLCEIGGGSGQLAWALTQHGFGSVSLLEPNSNFVTGTGYLRERRDALAIEIENDLSRWYASPRLYETILTRNCVHHFPNISMTACAIRKKMTPGALWFMIQEWFAETPTELYESLRTHPYSQKYRLYEFPFPAAHYIESTEIAGFELVGVVPAGYANDTIGSYAEDEGPRKTRRFTGRIDWLLRRAPAVTVKAYRLELFCNRYLGRQLRRFTRPQIMVFRKREISGK